MVLLLIVMPNSPASLANIADAAAVTFFVSSSMYGDGVSENRLSLLPSPKLFLTSAWALA
jgi:hypothetical protein